MTITECGQSVQIAVSPSTICTDQTAQSYDCTHVRHMMSRINCKIKLEEQSPYRHKLVREGIAKP